MDFENTANPYRFYGLIAAGCGTVSDVLFVQRLGFPIAGVTTAIGAVVQPTTKRVLRPKRLLRGLFAVPLVFTAASFSSLALAKIIKFDPKGSADTVPYAINANGTVAGTYYLTENGEAHGFFRAPDGKITNFDVPKAKCGTSAQGINGKGVITGSYADSSCMEHGFIRAGDGTITTFDVSGATATASTAINNAGVITGAYNVCSNGCIQDHGFLRDPDGTITTFDPKGSTETIPLSINKSGVIAGQYQGTNELYHGFLRSADGTITTFDVTGAEETFPYCINDSGAIAGYYFDGRTDHGFLRASDGNFTTVDPPGSIQTFGIAINNSGVVTGAYQTDTSIQQGFVRATDGTYTTFNPKGSVDTYPDAINNKGAITGEWNQQNPGPPHGFLRTP